MRRRLPALVADMKKPPEGGRLQLDEICSLQLSPCRPFQYPDVPVFGVDQVVLRGWMPDGADGVFMRFMAGNDTLYKPRPFFMRSANDCL